MIVTDNALATLMVVLPRYALVLQCISLVHQHFPDANGAEFSNIGGGWCNAVFGAVGVVYDPAVQTCLFEAFDAQDQVCECVCP
jgi:hypothetical protein